MQKIIDHPEYGKILYTENTFTGSKSLSNEGFTLPKLSKNVYLLKDKTTVTIVGNAVKGTSLQIKGQIFEITPPSK